MEEKKESERGRENGAFLVSGSTIDHRPLQGRYPKSVEHPATVASPWQLTPTQGESVEQMYSGTLEKQNETRS